MKYPAQSDIWRLDRLTGIPGTNGTNGTSRTLARFHQRFPLTLWRDQIIIEELRIIWVHKNGPWTSEVISIMATDIACVNASSGPLSGQIHILSLTGGPEIGVDKLLRRDVFRIRDLVEGIALSSREGLKIENGNLAAERESLMRAGAITI